MTQYLKVPEMGDFIGVSYNNRIHPGIFKKITDNSIQYWPLYLDSPVAHKRFIDRINSGKPVYISYINRKITTQPIVQININSLMDNMKNIYEEIMFNLKENKIL